MKKKLFLATVITTILCCLFAIGISAATTNEWGDVETVAGIDTSAMSTDTTALVVMFDGTEYHTYPANYVITSSSKLTVNYTPLNTALGSNVYASGSIIRLQIPNNVNNTGETMRGNSHGSALVEVDCSTAASEILIAHNAFHGCGKLVKANLSEKAYFASNNNYQFNGCSSLTSITLPSDITFLPTNLFSGCSSLTSVDMNWENITVVNSNAFNGCSKLSMEVDLSNVTIVNEAGFYNCSLVTFKNANNLTYAGKNSFRDCPYITSVEFTSDLTGIGSYAFVSSGLTSVVFNGGNNFKVDAEAFNGLSNLVGEFNLTGCTSVGKYAFKNCAKLTGTADLTSATSIGQQAFEGCTGLINVKFGASLTKIESQAFRSCTNLKFVEFGNYENALEMPNFGVFYGCTSLKAISLPKNTKSIPERCFYNCTALTAVYLGEKVVSFGSNADGQGAFDNCSQMYFVQNAFSVLKDDGTFPTTEEYVAPEKPAIYYMPESLTTLKGHVEKDFGYGTGSTVTGTFFKNCTSLNETIVFGTAFIYIPSCNMFHSAGTAESPKTIVFLADIQGSVTLTNSKYISYVFVNPADKSPADLGIVTVYPNYNNTESYMYFCATGLKYTYGLEHSELDSNGDKKYDQNNDNTNKKYSNAYNAAYTLEYEAAITAGNDETTAKAIATERATATAIAEEAKWIALAISAERNPATEGTKHVHNKDLDSTQEATCLLPAGKFTFCFCGAIMTEEIVEGSEALGHSDLNAIVEYYYKNNNYFDASYKKYTCTREGCGEVIDSQEGGIPALFKAMGMTVPDYGISALCHAIKIETDAVKEYNAYLGEGNEIKYGVLAGVAIDGNKPVGADGKSNCDAIVMGFESTNFSIVQLKLTGLEKANKQLYCGAYAVVDGTVSYLYEGTVSEYATPLIVNNGILDQTTPEATVEETKEN